MMRQDRFTEQAQEVLAGVARRWCASNATPSGTSSTCCSRCSSTRTASPRRSSTAWASTSTRCSSASPTTLERAPKLAYDVVQIYTTPRIVKMLETANAEAERLKDEYVGVEHLLIAIADEREGESARILREFDIDKERIYRALQEIRGSARVDSPDGESRTTRRWRSTAST